MRKIANFKAMFKSRIFLVFFCVLLIEISLIISFNIFFQHDHLGYDSSTYLLTAIKMWEQKRLILKDWDYQTHLCLDSSVPLAALIYGITGNIYISFGISNIIFDILILILLIKIFACLKLSPDSIVIGLSFIFCVRFAPIYYVPNALDYANSIFIGSAYYNFKTLVSLLIIYLSLIKLKKEHLFAIVLCLFLSFVTGLSSGFWVLATAVIPILIYKAILYVKNKDKFFYKDFNFVFLIGCFLIMFVGNIICKFVIGFSPKDSSMQIITLEKLAKSIISVPLGFMDLMQLLPAGLSIKFFSLHTVSYIFNWLVFLPFIIGIIYFIKKRLYQKNTNTKLLISVFLFDCILFSFLNVTYGQLIFETRYLIFPLFIIAPLSCYSYDEYFVKNKRVNDNNKVIKFYKKPLYISYAVFLLIAGGVIGTTVFCVNTNNYNYLSTLKADLNLVESNVIYCYGDDISIDIRNIRVVDEKKIYKLINNNGTIHHWGDYLSYDENSTLPGKVGFVISSDNYKNNNIPWYIKDKVKPVKISNKYVVCEIENNVFDFVSGFDNDNKTNIDYIYSPNVINNSSKKEESNKLVNEDDKTRCCLYGPYTKARKGKYKITLEYSAEKTGVIGEFILTCNHGQKTFCSTKIDSNNSSVNLNYEFDNEKDFEYTIYLEPGTSLEFKRIIMEKEN